MKGGTNAGTENKGDDKLTSIFSPSLLKTINPCANSKEGGKAVLSPQGISISAIVTARRRDGPFYFLESRDELFRVLSILIRNSRILHPRPTRVTRDAMIQSRNCVKTVGVKIAPVELT